MTRRLLAAVCLAASLGATAAPALAVYGEDHWLCIGGDNQRKPGYQQGICIDPEVLLGGGGY